MTAREAILGRLRESPRDSLVSTPQLDYSVIEEKTWDPEQRIALLTDNMTSVKTEVYRSSKTGWLEQLRKIARKKQLNNLLVSPETPYGETIFAAEDMPPLLQYERPIEEWKQELFGQVDASFTTTFGAIAETGSLVLWPDQHEPRLMSLVPLVHIALLEADSIEDTFLSFMRTHQWVQRGMPSNALLISGPSKTADIEQTLAYGVHGPKELIVIIV